MCDQGPELILIKVLPEITVGKSLTLREDLECTL
jgi:hypothetical protein